MNVYDCFRNVLDIYNNTQTSKRFEAWIAYMKKYPTLLNFCMLDYIEEGLSPRHIGLKKVFHRKVRIDYMMQAYNNLKASVLEAECNVQRIFPHTPIDIDIVLYHGLGNGAGTATVLNKRPTLLFGIEKIADLKWHNPERIGALFMHEYAHLLHHSVREESIEKSYDNPYDDAYYKLYIEGVATFLEGVLYKREVTQPNWFKQCINNEAKIKAAFLKTLELKEDVKPYFGDWNPPLDIPESAYFMGMQIVSMMHETMDIKTIMQLPFDDIKTAINLYFEV